MNKRDLNIIGAGSLGSFTTFLMAKMAIALDFKIKIYDHDKVELHNCDNQIYRPTDVGKFKVLVLKEIMDPLVENPIEAHCALVTKNTALSGIVVVLVDNMDVRREIFEACRYRADIPYYIEARTGGNVACVYAFDPRDPDCVGRYEKKLFRHSEGVNQPCANDETVPTLFAVADVIEKGLETAKKKMEKEENSAPKPAPEGKVSRILSTVLGKILVRYKRTRVLTGDFVESIINLEDLPQVITRRLQL